LITESERREIERVVWDTAIMCAADFADQVANEQSGGQLSALANNERSRLAHLVLRLLTLDPPKSEYLIETRRKEQERAARKPTRFSGLDFD
jgi:hypothetical protein